jgi:hypothetical protein
VDYGNRIDAWRRQVVDETIRSITFWLSVLELFALAVLILYVIYLHRQRNQRHAISADIVCQLYNAYAFASNKARTVIAEHNRWMRELNDDYEAQMRAGLSEESPSAETGVSISSVKRERVAYLGETENRTDDAVGTTNGSASHVSIKEPNPEEGGGDDILNKPEISAPVFKAQAWADNPVLQSAEDPQIAQTSQIDSKKLLETLNGEMAAQAGNIDIEGALKKSQEKAKALEAQNLALKHALNKQRTEQAAATLNPIANGGAE